MMPVPVTISPVLDAALGDARDIAGAVRAVTGPRGLAGMARRPAPKALELMTMALTEVLQTILDFSGAQDPDCAAVGLWVEPTLLVIAVRFAGPPLPDWLIANWDRGEPPAVLAPPGDSGWRWLVVREAFDSAGQQRARRGNLLFLEKRL